MSSKLKYIFLALILLFAELNFFAAQAANKKARRFKLVAKNKRYKKLFDNKLGKTRLFKDQFIIKFKNKKSRQSYISKFAMRNNLELVSQLGKNTYSFRYKYIEDATQTQIINPEFNDTERMVENYDIDEFKKLRTDAVKKNKKKKKGRRAISLSSNQWHLKNNGTNGLKEGADINVTDAWQYTKGAGIKVAVIDTGFDLRHKDINYSNSGGYDIVDDKKSAQAPTKSSENHGTAVAGIIAAKDDGRGVVGVAPEAEIIPIRLISSDGYVSISQIISAHRKAIELGAKIINNSWGSYDPGLASGASLDLTELEEDLYQELSQEALIVFASGNSGDSDFNNSPEARNPYTLSVGATNSSDQRASYSVYGDELDLVAPGGESKKILTTDRRDLKVKIGSKTKRYVLGYNKGNYANGFKGTSAAAPVVSGVAALVWAVAPDLSPEQVKTILKESARRNYDDYSFDSNDWNSELGYGIVDAYNAILQALDYSTN